MFSNGLKVFLVLVLFCGGLVSCSATSTHTNNLNRGVGMVSVNSPDYSIFNHDPKLNNLNNLLNKYQYHILPSTFVQINSSTSGGIQAAVDSASPGDTILLDGGNYTGAGNYNINITNKPALVIRASGIGGVPVIDAQGKGRIFNIISDNVLLDGLNITNGNISGDGTSGDGGGIIMANYDNVLNCNFINTCASFCGGGLSIRSDGGHGNVFNCSFINTSASIGGGIYSSGGDVFNCSFINTSASIGGGECVGNEYNIVGGCSFVGCSASDGGAIKTYSGAEINFNRFVNNSGPGNGITVDSNSVNVDYNWYGNNTPTPIQGGVMNNYYCVRLTANTSTKTLNNTMGDGVLHMQPGDVTLGYDLVLNTTNNSTGVGNLPIFNATQRVDTGIYNPQLFRDIGYLLLDYNPLPFGIGVPVDLDARASFNNTSTLSSFGDNATLTTTVDNLDMNITAIADLKGDSVVGILVNSSISSSDLLEGLVNLTNSVTGELFDGELNITIIDPNGGNSPFVVNTTDGMFNLSGLDYTLNSSSEYSLVVSFGGDGSHNPSNNSLVFGVHPTYDLSLRNNGSFTVGSWVDSVAIPVGGTPLDSDYAVFKVTKPNGESFQSDHRALLNNVFSYRWQLTCKGAWLVEVWAYDTNGNHIKAPQKLMKYSSNSTSSGVVKEAVASEVINV